VAAVLGALLAAGTLVACGGEDAREPSRSSAKERYVTEANAVCAKLGSETERLADETFGDLARPPSRRLQRDYQRRAAALTRRRVEELRALRPPPGDEEKVRAIQEALDQSIALLADQPVSEPGRARAPSIERFERLTREYGLTECGGRG
jgi:hypothetical protein